MKIRARDGVVLSLMLEKYECEDVDTFGGDDWLVVRAEIRLADGRRWAFAAPCLTAEEAAGLGRWWGAPEGERTFIEPLLAFRALDEGLEVRFSHEALPPWRQSGEPRAWLPRTFVVRLDLGERGRAQLEEAARVWAEGVARFAGRPVTDAGDRRVRPEIAEAERRLLASARSLG